MDVTSTAKLALASVYGYGLHRTARSSPVCKALADSGFYVSPVRLDAVMVDRLNAACDRVYDQRPESVSLESNGSDARIYGVDRLSDDPVFEELRQLFFDDAQIFYGSLNLEQFVMAGHITHRAGGLGSGSGWHRDSPYRHQFKVIVYLTDASEAEGPFEFIPNSHSTRSLVKAARWLRKPMSADRYANGEIDTLVEQGIVDRPATITGAAGTMVYADTRGLHRGRPLQSGRRRAITFYIYHNAIPATFNAVLAKQ
jgi:hypothetical protein